MFPRQLDFHLETFPALWMMWIVHFVGLAASALKLNSAQTLCPLLTLILSKYLHRFMTSDAHTLRSSCNHSLICGWTLNI